MTKSHNTIYTTTMVLRMMEKRWAYPSRAFSLCFLGDLKGAFVLTASKNRSLLIKDSPLFLTFFRLLLIIRRMINPMKKTSTS